MTETMTASAYREYIKTKPFKPAKKKQSNKGITHMKLLLDMEGIKYIQEYKFHPMRKWRFDFAIPEKKLALEYEGIFGGGKSRHTTVSGYTGDAEKYNEAAKLGWKVLRYTAKSYGKLIEDLKGIV